MLTRDAILSVVDLPRESVEVPEWGGTVCVRGMTAAERDAIEIETAERHKARKPTRFRALVVVACACDENGKALFEPGDVAALDSRFVAPIERVSDVALRLSKYSSADVRDLEKN